MHSIQETLKLKRAPTDMWTIREQLCLASSVLKSGDQNWISVSRSLKAIGDKDFNRSSDWFSQKSCAQQYASLLENADVPRRKKRESGETTSESVVRRLTQDRIFELSKILITQREEYQQLKNEICLIKNGTISLEKLQKIWHSIEQEEKELDQNSKIQSSVSRKPINNEDLQVVQLLSIQYNENKVADTSTVADEVSQNNTENNNRKNNNEQSSLLTSLLQSPSPATQLQPQTHSTNSPTIASLLCSSPKVPVLGNVQNVSPQLNQLASNTFIGNIKEQSSINAPTLSKLLEQSSTNIQTNLKQEINSSINSKNLQNPLQVQTIRTRSARLVQGNSIQAVKISQALSSQESANAETSKIIHSSNDKVMQEALPMDKNVINEIIGDIEEIIKEDMTSNPQSLNSTLNKIVPSERLNMLPSSPIVERSEPRNVDESASLSNSPTSEMAIEEIDSSSSNIAKIIGTAVETIEYKIETSNPSGIKGQEPAFMGDHADIDIKKELNDTYKVTQKITNSSQNNMDNQSDDFESNQIRKIKLEIADEQILENTTNLDKKMTDEETNRTGKYSSDYLVENQRQNYGCHFAIINDREFRNNPDDTSKKNVSVQEIQKLEKTSVSRRPSSESVEKKNEVEESMFENKTICHKIINEIDDNYASDNVDKKIDDVSELKMVHIFFPEREVQETSTYLKDTLKSQIKCEKKTLPSTNSRILKNVIVNDDILIKGYPTVIQLNNAIVKQEIVQEPSVVGKVEENSDSIDCKMLHYVKNEQTECDSENTDSDEFKKEKNLSSRNVEIKQENIGLSESTSEIDDEEPTIGKLQGGRAIKTYSKRQNTAIDSETENESSWENADYRAWKKSIMLVYHRLSTNKYASIFLRPITEDQAPGYHSIIFKPMDLSTIKKNIDNGTIRSTSRFQRDVMLMFQNAIMFNKYSTFVHKMTLEMQEECLQHMQVLVHAAGEASFKRETRTATNTINEANELGFKRKWSHINFSPLEVESHKNKKRKKSENE